MNDIKIKLTRDQLNNIIKFLNTIMQNDITSFYLYLDITPDNPPTQEQLDKLYECIERTVKIYYPENIFSKFEVVYLEQGVSVDYDIDTPKLEAFLSRDINNTRKISDPNYSASNILQ